MESEGDDFSSSESVRSFSDTFLASDDELEDGLDWDSGDSRPAAPSPPSTPALHMSQSPLENIRDRLRPRRARPGVAVALPASEPQSDNDSMETEMGLYQRTMIEEALHSIGTTTTDHGMSEDSDEFSETVSQSGSGVVREYPAASVQYSPPSWRPTSPLEIHEIIYDPYTRRTLEYNTYSPNSLLSSSPHSNEEDDGMQSAEDSNHPPSTVEISDNEDNRSRSPVLQNVEVARANSPEPEVQIIDPAPPDIEPPVLTPAPAVQSDPPDQPVRQTDNANSSILSAGDEGSFCTICLDPLTNSGKHRVVCLKCGHIFGHSCIERWIKVGCNNGARRCPSCNKKACLKDIRVLYLPKCVPLDTVERDRLIQEKDEVMAQKKAVEAELSRCKLQIDLNTQMFEQTLNKIVNKYNDEVEANKCLLRQKVSPTMLVNEVTGECGRLSLQPVQSVEISKEGGCRVLAYNAFTRQLIVSQPSGNTVFAGFGVRVLPTVDFPPTRFVFLHQKMIRDLAFHPEDRDLLLSVSLDQTAKLVDLSSGTTVHTYKGDAPLWSCCWEACNPHQFLVGSQLGSVRQYDRRMMDHYLNLWQQPNNTTPVVALSAAPPVPTTAFPHGGFFSCKLNSVLAYSHFGEGFKQYELSLDGPFMSMRYEPASQMLLTLTRPSSRCAHAKVSLHLIDKDSKGGVCTPQIHSFNCGSSARVLSRLTTVAVPGDSLVLAHQESGRTVNMWSTKTGDLVHSCPVKEPVIDMTSVSLPNKCLLATLSDKTVNIYKVT